MKEDNTMADSIVTPEELLGKLLAGGEVDLLREAAVAMLRTLMEIDVKAKTGAALGERSPDRLCMRNGYRERRLDTRVGTLELPIPKLREGSYFPSFLEPRRRSEEALFAVTAEAYVKGVSTRKVEDLAHALGIDSISKNQTPGMEPIQGIPVQPFPGTSAAVVNERVEVEESQDDLIQSVSVVPHACLLRPPDVLDKPRDFASASGAVSAQNEVALRDRAAAKVHRPSCPTHSAPEVVEQPRPDLRRNSVPGCGRSRREPGRQAHCARRRGGMRRYPVPRRALPAVDAAAVAAARAEPGYLGGLGVHAGMDSAGAVLASRPTAAMKIQRKDPVGGKGGGSGDDRPHVAGHRRQVIRHSALLIQEVPDIGDPRSYHLRHFQPG
jgi:hypothetical protein